MGQAENTEYYDPELELYDQLWAAEADGNDELAFNIRKKIKFSAASLMAAKKTHGADWVRTQQFDTTKADEKYGPDWLER